MMQHPDNVILAHYKVEGTTIPWEEEYYELFLKYLKEFLHVPTNNRRISISMSKVIGKNI